MNRVEMMEVGVMIRTFEAYYSQARRQSSLPYLFPLAVTNERL